MWMDAKLLVAGGSKEAVVMAGHAAVREASVYGCEAAGGGQGGGVDVRGTPLYKAGG